MNESLYEHIVVRKQTIMDIIKRVLTISVLILVFIMVFPIIGTLAFIIMLILGFLAYYFILQRLNLEYEYTLVNHEIDIDVIYNRQRRKKLLSFDFQQAEIIAPKNSPRLHSINIEKTHDFSSGNPENKVYAVIININQKRTCVLIEPDQGMINHIRPWMGSKFHLD